MLLNCQISITIIGHVLARGRGNRSGQQASGGGRGRSGQPAWQNPAQAAQAGRGR